MAASSTAGSRRARILLAAVAVLSLSRPAIAQPPPTDAALAEALFQDAKALMASGRYVEACPKLAESQRLDPGTGTLMALALCHEGEGKSASAWAEFTEVATQKGSRADRVKVAREHIQKLEQNLSRLTITVAPGASSVKGLEVTRDGIAIGAAVWGTAMPIDPGAHTIEASAPGKKRWTTTAEIKPNGDRQTIAVPALADDVPDKVAPPPPPPPDTGASHGSGRRTAGFIVGGAGILALGVGGYFGARAISKSSYAKARCSPTLCTDPNAVAANNDAKVSAKVSDITMGVGIAAVGVGLVLVLTAPSASEPMKPSAQAAPWVGPGGGGLTVRGAF